jgi:hypothetical protein
VILILLGSDTYELTSIDPEIVKVLEAMYKMPIIRDTINDYKYESRLIGGNTGGVISFI